MTVSYTHLRAHETDSYIVCRLLLEKKKENFELFYIFPPFFLTLTLTPKHPPYLNPDPHVPPLLPHTSLSLSSLTLSFSLLPDSLAAELLHQPLAGHPCATTPQPIFPFALVR